MTAQVKKLTVRVRVEMDKALTLYSKRNDLSKTQAIRLAIRKLLKEE